MGLGANVAVALQDASEDGVLLVVKEPLAIGQEVEVEISTPGVSKPLKRYADVVWSASRAAGDYWAGCRLRKRFRYVDFINLT